jgi:hypothetical protein
MELSAKRKRILVAYKLQGGQGTIGDARKAAGVDHADYLVRPLVKGGLLRNPTRNFYVLTAEGVAIASKLIEEEDWRDQNLAGPSSGFADRATAKPGDFEVWNPLTREWKRI